MPKVNVPEDEIGPDAGDVAVSGPTTDLTTEVRKLFRTQALLVEADRLQGFIQEHGVDPVRRLEALARWEAVMDELADP